MITQEELKKLFTYCPETGVFTTNITYQNHAKVAGQSVGYINYSRGKEYLNLRIKGIQYKIAVLAFLYMEGELPDTLIDHINGDSLDNRWCNLRKADPVTNAWNRKRIKTNSSGIKGLYIREDGIQIRIVANKRIYSKFFSYILHGEQEDVIGIAEEYLRNLRESLHGEFANHG
jgi:hypothetical protein